MLAWLCLYHVMGDLVNPRPRQAAGNLRPLYASASLRLELLALGCVCGHAFQVVMVVASLDLVEDTRHQGSSRVIILRTDSVCTDTTPKSLSRHKTWLGGSSKTQEAGENATPKPGFSRRKRTTPCCTLALASRMQRAKVASDGPTQQATTARVQTDSSSGGPAWFPSLHSLLSLACCPRRAV